MTVFSGSDDKGAFIAAGSGTYTDQFWVSTSLRARPWAGIGGGAGRSRGDAG